ncbi:MAG: flagellar biosynthetic protein FliO [Pseudomonadota bacterium]
MNRLLQQFTVGSLDDASATINNAATSAATEGLDLGSPLAMLPVFGNLLLIIAVILAGAWLLKKLVKPGIHGSNAIEIVAAQNIGNRERVLVVNVGDQQLVVGSTPNSVTTLYVPETPLLNSSENPGSFAKKLRDTLAGGKQ